MYAFNFEVISCINLKKCFLDKLIKLMSSSIDSIFELLNVMV